MIGLGITAYSRPDYLRQCLQSAKEHNYGGARIIRVSIDFKDQETSDTIKEICEEFNVAYYKATKNITVAGSKNWLIKELLSAGCEHLFIMEDDILIKHQLTCQAYIDEANRLKLKHLNFGLHGKMNSLGVRKIVQLQNNEFAYVYPHIVGAFSYYHRDYIEKYGYMDEHFVNAWEHVEHTYRGCIAEDNPPFWFFVDHPLSHLLLEEIPGSIDHSSIVTKDNVAHKANIKKGQDYWMHKYGMWLPPFPEKFYKR